MSRLEKATEAKMKRVRSIPTKSDKCLGGTLVQIGSHLHVRQSLTSIRAPVGAVPLKLTDSGLDEVV